jgi:coenzyme F420 hydrogenase subunit beta
MWNDRVSEIMKNIAAVVNARLCTGCGTCSGICPNQAITMQIVQGSYEPRIEETKCTGCKLCAESCPGYFVNFDELNKQIFGRHSEDRLIGNFLECYVGHSKDREIEYDSSSGGLITGLLVFALEKGLIDGALVVRMKKDKPLETEPFIAKTRQEILSASKSKYCPVAANQALRDILKEKGRFAIVGLPCHIHGIRKAERKIGNLDERIVLHIGLICSHSVSYAGTMLLLNKLGVNPKQIAEIRYRGRGWPGSMHIKLQNGSVSSIPYTGKWKAYWPLFSSFFFTPTRCMMCPDETNELADISVGDAWLSELRNEKRGRSVVVARTRRGAEILKRAQLAGVLSLKSISQEHVMRSQAEPIKFKKVDLPTRLAVMRSEKMKTPLFVPRPNSSYRISSFARSSYVLFNCKVSNMTKLTQMSYGIPLPIHRLYYGLYKLLCKI